MNLRFALQNLRLPHLSPFPSHIALGALDSMLGFHYNAQAFQSTPITICFT